MNGSSPRRCAMSGLYEWQSWSVAEADWLADWLTSGGDALALNKGFITVQSAAQWRHCRRESVDSPSNFITSLQTVPANQIVDPTKPSVTAMQTHWHDSLPTNNSELWQRWTFSSINSSQAAGRWKQRTTPLFFVASTPQTAKILCSM